MKTCMKSQIAGVVFTVGMLLGCQPSQPTTESAEPPAPAESAAQSVARTPADPRMAPDDPLQRLDEGMPERDTTPVDTKVTEVKLSNQGDTEKNTLGMPTSRFDAKDSVYAEILSEGTASEYTIYAKWIGADGTVLSDYGIKVNEAGPKRTVISLSKPDGWPQGQNRIELAINGAPQRTVTFEVQ